MSRPITGIFKYKYDGPLDTDKLTDAIVDIFKSGIVDAEAYDLFFIIGEDELFIKHPIKRQKYRAFTRALDEIQGKLTLRYVMFLNEE